MFIRLCFLTALYLGTLSFQAHAVEVEAQGQNERQAINNALRQAVEMVIGVQIESNSLTENFQVVRQQILSHSKGYVTSYEVLSKETLASGFTKVQVRANVDEARLSDSSQALSSLMQMASHPRIFVAGIKQDFNAISPLSDEFQFIQESLETLLRTDFKFDVIDTQTARVEGADRYRYSDRKNLLARAKRAKADFAIFIEVIQNDRETYQLNLTGSDLNTGNILARESKAFTTRHWAGSTRQDRKSILIEAKEQVYAPGVELAASLVENIRKEVYEEGQRYELSFSRFQPEDLKHLSDDLATLEGYVRHKVSVQEKNTLTLSYWSVLQASPLQNSISQLLNNQDLNHNTRLRGRTIQYRFKDPLFE